MFYVKHLCNNVTTDHRRVNEPPSPHYRWWTTRGNNMNHKMHILEIWILVERRNRKKTTHLLTMFELTDFVVGV